MVQDLWFKENSTEIYRVRIDVSFARWPIFSSISSMLICAPQKVEVVIVRAANRRREFTYMQNISHIVYIFLYVTCEMVYSEKWIRLSNTKTVNLRLARNGETLLSCFVVTICTLCREIENVHTTHIRFLNNIIAWHLWSTQHWIWVG